MIGRWLSQAGPEPAPGTPLGDQPARLACVRDAVPAARAPRCWPEESRKCHQRLRRKGYRSRYRYMPVSRTRSAYIFAGAEPGLERLRAIRRLSRKHCRPSGRIGQRQGAPRIIAMHLPTPACIRPDSGPSRYDGDYETCHRIRSRAATAWCDFCKGRGLDG